MDGSQLPEKAAKILRDIRKKYTVGFEPFRVDDTSVELLKVTELDSLLKGKDPFENVSEFPFWIRVWEAAIVLAKAMVNLPHPPGATLLELGAGLGAPGLIAASHGFQVTLSDYEAHILDFQRVSAAASGIKGIEHKIIDWTKPPQLIQFDLLVGAEVIFREDLFQPLLEVFDQYLAPGGEIYLAHDHRRKSLYSFMEQAEKQYRIMGKKVAITSDGTEKTIILNRLERK